MKEKRIQKGMGDLRVGLSLSQSPSFHFGDASRGEGMESVSFLG